MIESPSARAGGHALRFGLEAGRPYDGRFSADARRQPVAVTVLPTPRLLEIRDAQGLLVAAWAWNDVVRPRPATGTGLALHCRPTPGQRLDIDVPPPSGGRPAPRPRPRASPEPGPDSPSSRSGPGRALDALLAPFLALFQAPSRAPGDPLRLSGWPWLRARLALWRLTLASPRRLLKGGGLALVAFLLGGLGGLGLLSLPGVANRLEAFVPASAEQAWGDALLARFHEESRTRVCDALPGRLALDRLLRRLDRAHPAPWPLTAEVLHTPAVVALGFPGGHLVFSEGLLLSLRSPDEVAGIVAQTLAQTLLRQGTVAVLRRHGARAFLPLLVHLHEARPLRLESYLETGLARSMDQIVTADAQAMGLLRDAGLRARSLSLFIEDQTLARPGQNEPGSDAARPETLGALEIPAFVQNNPLSSARLRRLGAAPRGGDVAMDPVDWTDLRLICQ
ncbi:hypothetical protein ROR02_18360 [Pararhodospirillum oryzae]|uniref:Peptidase M48 domain-containing protein n=2 Tax=Pararhodospirillum oryzae TaxID=478448 RepID=A0A512H8C8_9PROT|nr:hypothetical protein ROR02_18360 [Pararhodospirillum oryzae]